jgi:NhaP-type Na+/H+ and K+/H+ antiporter
VGKNTKLELGVPIFLIVVSAAFLWDSRTISGIKFDPLGAAPIPRLICGCVIALCMAIILQTLLASKQSAPEAPDSSEVDCQPQPRLAIITLLLTSAYVAAMAFRLCSFSVATIVYLVATIGALDRFSRKSLIIGGIIALVMGFGCQYLFTEIFVIDLPTGSD